MIEGDVSAATGRTTAADEPRRGRRAPADAVTPLAERAEELVALVKAVEAKPKPRNVHKLRTTIRRVEALLPADDTQTRAERRVRKQLARLRRRAGKVRDADVHLEALRALDVDPDAAAARDAVGAALEKQRAKREKKLVRTLAKERDRGVVKRLREVVATAVVDRSATDEARVLATVLGDFARALGDAAPLGAATLHDFRIHTKRLRYVAESALPAPNARRAVAELKRVQDAIGAWHDWMTLIARARKTLDDQEGTALLSAIGARAEAELAKAVAATMRGERRLHALGAAAERKGTRPVTSGRAPLALRSAGASA
jgi:CHAD domain-containing protein